MANLQVTRVMDDRTVLRDRAPMCTLSVQRSDSPTWNLSSIVIADLGRQSFAFHADHLPARPTVLVAYVDALLAKPVLQNVTDHLLAAGSLRIVLDLRLYRIESPSVEGHHERFGISFGRRHLKNVFPADCLTWG